MDIFSSPPSTCRCPETNAKSLAPPQVGGRGFHLRRTVRRACLPRYQRAVTRCAVPGVDAHTGPLIFPTLSPWGVDPRPRYAPPCPSRDAQAPRGRIAGPENQAQKPDCDARRAGLGAAPVGSLLFSRRILTLASRAPAMHVKDKGKTSPRDRLQLSLDLGLDGIGVGLSSFPTGDPSPVFLTRPRAQGSKANHSEIWFPMRLPKYMEHVTLGTCRTHHYLGGNLRSRNRPLNPASTRLLQEEASFPVCQRTQLLSQDKVRENNGFRSPHRTQRQKPSLSHLKPQGPPGKVG